MATDDSTTSKSPAFQFYPNDFLSDANVIGMSLQERGAYITLLCVCWQQGTLPADVGRLARLCGSPVVTFRRLWPALEPCFRVDSEHTDHLVHPRLEREREKQADYRRKQSDKGRASGAARSNRKATETNHGSTTVQSGSPSVATGGQPEPNSLSSSSSSSSSSDFSQKNGPAAEFADARSKRPIFKGTRFVVFEWQLDDLRKMLGPHVESFDLHEWFFTLSVKADAANIVVPQRDGGKWLMEQTIAEAVRRGLPVATASTGTGKTAGNYAALARFAAKGATA